jgi:hypothetical protein
MSKPRHPAPASHDNLPARLVGVHMYRSPLPPAEELAAYEDAYPGTADRLISMAELDQRAEIQEVRFQQRAKFAVDIFGQFFLFGLVGAAVFLAVNDKPLEAPASPPSLLPSTPTPGRSPTKPMMNYHRQYAPSSV